MDIQKQRITHGIDTWGAGLSASAVLFAPGSAAQLDHPVDAAAGIADCLVGETDFFTSDAADSHQNIGECRHFHIVADTFPGKQVEPLFRTGKLKM